MKYKIRSIVLIILVICLGLIAACSKEDPEIEDISTEDLNLNVGFLTSKYQEGDNSVVDILVEGDGLKLEVKDQEYLIPLWRMNSIYLPIMMIWS